MSRLLGSSLLFASLVIAACSGKSDGNAGSQADGLAVYRDGCDADACAARPAPAHLCAGGYAVTVCTKARGACGWQVDCADEAPAGYDGSIGVSSCASLADGTAPCGQLPSSDEKDCVYGVIGEPQCESYDRQPCAWSQRCRPQPCDQKGTCNTLDRSKLGVPCGADVRCPSGSSCASVFVNLGETEPPRCIQGDPCSALTCAPGGECQTQDSYPAQVVCGRGG